MPILESVANNVQSTLSFNLASRMVYIVGVLRGSSGSDPRDSTLFLCIGILLLSSVPVLLPSMADSARKKMQTNKRHGENKGNTAVISMGASILGMASEVTLLAFSRIVMQQVTMTQRVPATSHCQNAH